MGFAICSLMVQGFRTYLEEKSTQRYGGKWNKNKICGLWFNALRQGRWLLWQRQHSGLSVDSNKAFEWKLSCNIKKEEKRKGGWNLKNKPQLKGKHQLLSWVAWGNRAALKGAHQGLHMSQTGLKSAVVTCVLKPKGIGLISKWHKNANASTRGYRWDRALWCVVVHQLWLTELLCTPGCLEAHTFPAVYVQGKKETELRHGQRKATS